MIITAIITELQYSILLKYWYSLIWSDISMAVCSLALWKEKSVLVSVAHVSYIILSWGPTVHYKGLHFYFTVSLTWSLSEGLISHVCLHHIGTINIVKVLLSNLVNIILYNTWAFQLYPHISKSDIIPGILTCTYEDQSSLTTDTIFFFLWLHIHNSFSNFKDIILNICIMGWEWKTKQKMWLGDVWNVSLFFPYK